MIEITTKNGFTITCDGITSSADGALSFENLVTLYSPEIKIGIILIMNMDVALISSKDMIAHRLFSRYWDEKDFNNTINEAGENGGGWAVILESIKFLEEYIDSFYQHSNVNATCDYTA